MIKIISSDVGNSFFCWLPSLIKTEDYMHYARIWFERVKIVKVEPFCKIIETKDGRRWRYYG